MTSPSRGSKPEPASENDERDRDGRDAATRPGSRGGLHSDEGLHDKNQETPAEKEMVFEQIELDSEDSADDEYEPSDEGEASDINQAEDEEYLEDEMKLDFDDAGRAELDFEVDVLPSSDEEGLDDQSGVNEATSQERGAENRLSERRVEDDSGDGDETVMRDHEGNEISERDRKAYLEFLAALFREKPPAGDSGSSRSVGDGAGMRDRSDYHISSHSAQVQACDDFLLPDDDPADDPSFDYLAAAASFTEDKEEYRDDPAVHVSRREISELISAHLPPPRPRRVARPEPQEGTIEPPSSQLTLQPSRPEFTPIQQRVAPRDAGALTPDMVQVLQQQMATHVQMLLHLHVNAPPSSAGALGSAKMLNTLSDMRNVTLAYKRTFAPYLRYPQAPGPYHPSAVQSYFDTPNLAVVPKVLEATAGGTQQTTQDVLRSCGVSDRVLPANKRMRSSSSPLGEVAESPSWTEGEDGLLAFILATKGIGNEDKGLPGERKWAALPHKSDSQCEARVRELSSRRARDNPVKHVILSNAKDQAITKDEWRRIKEVVSRIGESDWKAIAAEANVSAQPDVIEREWRYRKRKRLAKKRERLRAKSRRNATLPAGEKVDRSEQQRKGGSEE